MKIVLNHVMAFAWVMSTCSGAMAAQKICFGSTKSDMTKGEVIQVDIENRSIAMKEVRGNLGYTGTYPIANGVVHGRDGNTYVQYVGLDGDWQDYIMVDEKLFSARTTGLMEIRGRGEGYDNYVFVCKDAQ